MPTGEVRKRSITSILKWKLAVVTACSAGMAPAKRQPLNACLICCGRSAGMCPEPELLLLDEPTSGLDPIVRREFIETVIGAYQEGNPGNRTILVSTHLISEFEGLIDEFTIMDRGRGLITLRADEARDRYKRIRARFSQSAPELDLSMAVHVRRAGRELDLIVNGGGREVMDRLQKYNPEALTTEALTLE